MLARRLKKSPGPARRIGTPIPVPAAAESGNGDSLFPGQVGKRGFPLRFPAKKRESGDPVPDSRVTSRGRRRASTAVDSEYTPEAASIMPVLSQAACGSYSGFKHAAASDEHQPHCAGRRSSPACRSTVTWWSAYPTWRAAQSSGGPPRRRSRPAAPRKRGRHTAVGRTASAERQLGLLTIRVSSYTLETSSCRRGTCEVVLRNAATVPGHVLGIHTLPERKIQGSRSGCPSLGWPSLSKCSRSC
jgi:hypothetical protein